METSHIQPAKRRLLLTTATGNGLNTDSATGCTGQPREKGQELHGNNVTVAMSEDLEAPEL